MRLFLSPHSDDETLFGAYTLLRHRPLVVVCFDGRRRRHYVASEIREAETAAATRILGCDHRFLHVQCDPPDWVKLETLLSQFAPEAVWAPLPEEDGHSHHNGVGELAARLWPDRTTFYATYTTAGKSTVGDLVPVEPGWDVLKRRALACYVSQIARPGTRPHFDRPLDEYVRSGMLPSEIMVEATA